MDKNELPSSVPLPNALLFNDEVPPVVLRTFARLYALAWKHHYDRTDRLTTDDLLLILDLSMRQMYDHIAKLRRLGVLEWTSDGQYGYIFTFPKSSGGAFVPDEALQDAAVSAWVATPATAGLRPEPASAENRSWDLSEPVPTAENRSPAAEIRSWNTPEPTPVAAVAPDPVAEIRSWDLSEPAPTAENRTPAAEIRSWDSATPVPTAENRSPAADFRSQQPSVVVVVDTIPDPDLNKQQQQHGERLNLPTAENRSPGAEIRTWPELEAALTRAGMWNDLAEGLTANLDVDGVLDALGWIAAVRADRRVHNHGAVLVKQLQAGRHAPKDWRPPAVCAACGVVEDQCTCGARERVVPAVYYTAAIDPLSAWGRDRWGVCQTCGRVDCAGHDVAEGQAVEDQVAAIVASNGASGKGNGLESRIRGAWQGVAQYIQARYGVEINLVDIGNHEVQVTFAGDERWPILNLTRTMLGREVKDHVEVIDAGPA